MNIELLPIDQIGLSTRSCNALHRMGVHCVGEMLGQTRETLSAAKNLGQKSVEEILAKIEAYRQMANAPEAPVSPEDFSAWLEEGDHSQLVTAYLQEKEIPLEALELLSPRAFNLLMLQGYEKLWEIAFLTEEQLLQIPRMDAASAGEIRKLTQHYLRQNESAILAYAAKKEAAEAPSDTPSIFALLAAPEYHNTILAYVKANDREVQAMGLSTRPQSRLLQAGYARMSDLVFVPKETLYDLPSMGKKSVEEILAAINAYWEEHGKRAAAVCTGDTAALLDDNTLQNRILKLYLDSPFLGLSLQDITERLQLPQEIPQKRLKRLIGGLLAAGELEYVDYRCYRVYGKFREYAAGCEKIDQRSRDFVEKRLQGITLEAIAQENGLTRERVRQVVKKAAAKIQEAYIAETGLGLFDEDYYRYLYENYIFDKKEASAWLGVPSSVWNYLELCDIKRGSQELSAALDDPRLGVSLRLKIKTYLNRNKLYLNGKWVEKKRADLEEIVVEKFCADSVSFDEFAQLYNNFLREEDVAFDEDVYYTPAVYRTRKNRLADARFLLWTPSEQLRYYDIDGRDYTELLDALHLDGYENVELSTLKFTESYPALMEKYDIRDHYELHNLLRKIIPEGDFHDLHFGRTPEIKFGTFDRTAAMFDLMMENAPISAADLAELAHQEYGYDHNTALMNYLTPLSRFYHQGYYTVDQKVMSYENRLALQKRLTDDFYYLDEVRRIYRELFPSADPEEINPYNLKSMGFLVLSHYVLQHHTSLDAYFEALLTKEDTLELSAIRRRFGSVQLFYQKLLELKRELRVVEYLPDRIIHIRRLEQSGITREAIRAFCQRVYAFAEDGVYFSIPSLQDQGFSLDWEEYGFSPWFYANLLLSDSRFSYSRVFNSMVFCKGTADVTIKSFLTALIRSHGSIDVYDLMSELSETYGCQVDDKWDVIYKVQNTEIYYDKILDRLYASADLYYQELDEM